MSTFRFDGLPDPASGQVVVDHAAGLHGRVDRRRADEPEAHLLQPLDRAVDSGVVASQSPWPAGGECSAGA